MVWSVTNRARWFVRDDSFRFFLPLADLLSNGSFAAGIFRDEAAPTELAPVRPDAWLDRQAAEHVDTLLEHSSGASMQRTETEHYSNKHQEPVFILLPP